MSNLPLQTMPFVGRADEIVAIARQLTDPTCCLLTLVGPGGMGKTRLALEVAHHIAQTHPPRDGIYFVDLQPVQSGDLLLTAIANTLGILLSGGTDPRTQLMMYLKERDCLLLLDNFEQLLDSVDLLTDMLKAAPDIKLVVTSREALNIQEEWVWQVGGLQVPLQQPELGIESYSAVQLFVERARRSRQNFSLIGQEAFVTRTCQLVEGMPLALELAASWTKALSCAEIANEIQRGLDFLTTNKRNVLERHQSMQAVFDHSWRLLTDAERQAFPKLSVFRGGFRREAAAQVAGASLAVLAGLVDKSFLRVNEDGRYDIHELMRQYGEEHFNTVLGAKKNSQNQHCTYFADFLHQRQPTLRSPEQAGALDEIENELDNIRESWRWAVEQGMEHEIHQSMHSLFVFCHIRSQAVDGERLFELAIKRFEQKDSAVLAYLLLTRTWMAWFNGRGVGIEQFPRAIRMAYAFWTEDEIALPLGVYFHLRDELLSNRIFDDAQQEQVYRHFLKLFRLRDQHWAVAYMLYCLGRLLHHNAQYDEAEQYCRESKDIFLQIGDRWAALWSDLVLVPYLVRSGRYSEALQLLQNHEDIAIELKEGDAIVSALTLKADIAWKQQDYRAAKQHVAEGMRCYLKTGSHFLNVAGMFYVLVDGFVSEKRYARAAELMSFLRQYADTAYAPEIRDIAGQKLDILVEKIPPEIYQQAVERGKKLHFRIILEQLLDELSDSSSQTQPVESLPHSSSNQSLLDPLTERESEVLRLLAVGRSNREIAQDLVLALGTVKWYISEIYSKLGVASRTQAIARAAELNLLP